MKLGPNILVILALVTLAVTGILHGGAIAQVEPGPVDYGPTITTDREKLFACYSLIEEMRLEHNRIAGNFRSRLVLESAPKDKEELAAKKEQGFIRDWCPEGFMLADTPENNSLRMKFRTYAHQSKALQKQLLAEQNRLKESIRWATYTLKEWEAISDLGIGEGMAINTLLFGNKTAEKGKPTDAASTLLDELKALNLDDLPEKSSIDPTEDFSTYTEEDPNSRISKTADRATFTDLSRDEDAWLVDDKGVAHFNENFEFLFKTLLDAGTESGMVYLSVLSNIVDDTEGIKAANEDYLGSAYFYLGIGCRFYIIECDGGTEYADYGDISLDTVYYIEFERDEDVGTYGTLYDYVCTTDYWDDGGDQVDTLTVTIHTSKKDFRHIFGVNTDNIGNSDRTLTGYIELLDLQEDAPEAGYSFGYIIGG